MQHLINRTQKVIKNGVVTDEEIGYPDDSLMADKDAENYIESDGAPEGAKERLTNWVKEPTLTTLKGDLVNAQSTHDAHVDKVDSYLDNLYVRNTARRKKRKNRSSVTPRLIMSHAEWRYPTLTEPYLSKEDMINAIPKTAMDKQYSVQSSLLLNHQWNHRFNKIDFMDRYARALVNHGSVIIKMGWARKTKKEIVEVPETVVQLVNDPNTGQVIEQEVPTGRMLQQEVETVISNYPTAEVCDYRDIIIDPTCKGDLNKAKFVIHKYNSNISDLKAKGIYKNLKFISENEVSSTYSDYNDDITDDFKFTDNARKMLEVYEYWGYWDKGDGNGLSPILVVWINNIKIFAGDNPFPRGKLPYEKVDYLPNDGLYGFPDGEFLKEHQNINGALMRSVLDLTGKSAAGQVGRVKGVLDPNNKKLFDANLPYEINQGHSFQEVFHQHEFPQTPAIVFDLMTMITNNAESLSGIKSFSQGVNGNQYGDVVAGIKSALDATTKRDSAILRRVTKGLVNMFTYWLEMNATFLEAAEVVRVTDDQFVEINPSNLRDSSDILIVITTPEKDAEEAQQSAFLLQTMGNTVDPGITKIILADLARLRNKPDIAKQIEEYQPQPDPLEEERKQLEIQLLQAQILNEQGKARENIANGMKDEALTEKIKAETDLLDLEYIEQESGVHQERELEKVSKQATAQGEHKITESLMKNSLEREKLAQQERLAAKKGPKNE